MRKLNQSTPFHILSSLFRFNYQPSVHQSFILFFIMADHARLTASGGGNRAAATR
jgi:hypothetical protein